MTFKVQIVRISYELHMWLVRCFNNILGTALHRFCSWDIGVLPPLYTLLMLLRDVLVSTMLPHWGFNSSISILRHHFRCIVHIHSSAVTIWWHSANLHSLHMHPHHPTTSIACPWILFGCFYSLRSAIGLWKIRNALACLVSQWIVNS